MPHPELIVPHKVTLHHVDYCVRPLHAGDESLLQRFFYSHTKETIRLRYGYTVSLMTKERAHQLVDVDEHVGLALGILSQADSEEILHAVGRYCVEGKRRAEVAFVVRESKRRCGMATVLLHELARGAQAHGIEIFRAQVLRENYAMRRLLERYRPKIQSDPESGGLDYFVKVRKVNQVLRRAA